MSSSELTHKDSNLVDFTFSLFLVPYSMQPNNFYL